MKDKEHLLTAMTDCWGVVAVREKARLILFMTREDISGVNG